MKAFEPRPRKFKTL